MYLFTHLSKSNKHEISSHQGGSPADTDMYVLPCKRLKPAETPTPAAIQFNSRQTEIWHNHDRMQQLLPLKPETRSSSRVGELWEPRVKWRRFGPPKAPAPRTNYPIIPHSAFGCCTGNSLFLCCAEEYLRKNVKRKSKVCFGIL